MRLTWQNLSEGKRLGLVRHGRAWFRSGGRQRGRDPKQPRVVAWEWRFGRWDDLRLMLTTRAEERDYTIAIGLGWASLHVSLEGVRAWPFDQRTVFGFHTGFYLFEDHLVLQWRNDSSSSGDAPGWSKSWFLKDVLLGRAKYISFKEWPVDCWIDFPEGRYDIRVVMHDDRWYRPRWPWPLRIRRATIDCPTPIPVPGKGENSWDCGEDAVHSLTCPAADVAEALSKLRESVERSRQKYGGRGWKPEAAAR